MSRSRLRSSVAAFAAVASFAAGRNANAQLDTNPPLQNVMLLVDSSGSMEFSNDGTPVQCDEKDSTLPVEVAPQGPSQKSRWMQLVEVLTGDVNVPQCYSQDRRSTEFRDEYKLGSANPYDFNYHVPYHRFLSVVGGTKCTVGAGVVDSNPFSWGATPFRYHPFNDRSNTTSCTGLQQAETGLLDSYRDRMRFGLMTFDTSVDAGTGLSAVSTPDYVNGNTGTWSYFLNWRANPDCNSNGACAKGKPAGCAVSTPMEVGARNAAAPPWEGRMVPFGSPTAPIAEIRTTNDRIQQALTALRPFGATPINGLLNDAREFFVNDQDNDYVNNKTCDHDTGVGCFGPKYDGLVQHGCRKNNIILLTDGEPNLDLRPYCQGPGSDPSLDGACPYPKDSLQLVQELADPAGASIQTFVIGFAVSTVTTAAQPVPVDCHTISTVNSRGGSGTFDPGGLCGAGMDPKLSACCTLSKIAFAGGTANAYFATNATELRTAISQIFDRIGGTVSTRTVPVFAASNNAKFGGAFSFFSSFRSGRTVDDTTSSGPPDILRSSVWTGVLERRRTECIKDTAGGVTTILPTALPIDPELGDDFSANVNAADTSHPRAFYTVIPALATGGERFSKRSIRPGVPSTNPDGLGTYSGTPFNGGVSTFVPPDVPATALGISKTACSDVPLPATDDDCAKMFLKWEVGADPSPYTNRRNDVFGAVYHSTPILVAAPGEFLRDESYTQFTVEQVLRPPVLYTATTDGQLHAFKVDGAAGATTDKVDKKVNNELWSFFPPAALPKIPAQYPSTPQVILDGSPVVKDVVYVRSDADAKSGGAGMKWHTILLSSFGAGGPGYFALDVTNPVPKSGDPNTGPKMLWQLTTDEDGHDLFGKGGGTPAIATLFFGQGNTGDPQEYAVAILPGGQPGTAPSSTPCTKPPTTLVDSAFPARDNIRCLIADPARSLTIVRLDTGEVVRSFRREVDAPLSIQARSKDTLNAYTPLIAAISGQPVVFPSETGAVADRAFVGDNEGLLWRVDLHSQNPAEWKMELFFDAYTGQAADAGEPIATPPILSVDVIGNVTVAFSTGDQEAFIETPSMQNYLWSLLEDSHTTPPFKSLANWSSTFLKGERVSGPMQLFNSNVYYTVYKPPPISPGPSEQCSSGQSTLCAVHYLRPASTAHNTGGEVAKPALDVTKPDDPCISQGSAVIFGPGITQEPTCFATDTFNDPYLGTDKHTSLSNVTAGKFNLVMQTGATGKNETKGQINTTTIALQPPLTGTRIDSWAAVIE